ncbi:hypothetical protein CWC46_19260 [Prodigiosinella confusarubida]|uniref:Uncharacterized protein n=1 Tax=Serratia sp. (strain ATCC 39006) TaxID=104623 RepID=A0A2I5TB24_SERS3|nr:hypothetical protein [Serratia sp. ATCC 39006]AUH01753.1 hypothetical protein CWC46_19260 [Serratia sp. ATCC 39006]AUH06076.1 hypothetical protein Ser39006_019260 [Serratia sp. ATCC 39006]
MAISGLETHSQNVKSFYPLITTISSVSKGDSSSDSTSNDALANLFTTPDASTKVTLSPDGKNKSNAAQSTGSISGFQEKTAEQEVRDKQEKQREGVSPKRSLEMMNGIPLYGGTLVSMTSYPDGSWKALDVFTGQPVTSANAARMSQQNSSKNLDMFNFYSQGIYKGMSAAEIYEKIQQMLSMESDGMSWEVVGSSDLFS